MSDGEHFEARKLAGAVAGSLDDSGSPEDWARQTFHSRTQFYRLFQALIDETPAAMRRRLLLERAAWHLAHTARAVTEIALDAGYESLEAFSRAFRRVYQVPPSLFRRSGSRLIHLPAPNGIHFSAPAPSKKGANHMDLYDIFAGTDAWYTKRLLEHAASASDEQLDRGMNFTGMAFGWGPDKSLREVLERIVMTKELWSAAMTGSPMPEVGDRPAADRTPSALLKRFEAAEAAFQRVFSDIRARGAWDDKFVDALCEPPATFTFAGTFAHIITFNTQRRMLALHAFEKLGIPMKGIGCPMEYEESATGERVGSH